MHTSAQPPEPILIQQILQSPPSLAAADSPLASFGLYLGSLRRKRGLSLEAAAAAGGIQPERWARIELGEVTLAELAGSLPALSQALGESEASLARLCIALLLG